MVGGRAECPMSVPDAGDGADKESRDEPAAIRQNREVSTPSAKRPTYETPLAKAFYGVWAICRPRMHFPSSGILAGASGALMSPVLYTAKLRPDEACTVPPPIVRGRRPPGASPAGASREPEGAGAGRRLHAGLGRRSGESASALSATPCCTAGPAASALRLHCEVPICGVKR